MKKLGGLVGLVAVALVLPACGGSNVEGFETGYRSMLTGKPCVPDGDTLNASDDSAGALSANASDRAREKSREEAVAARRGARSGSKHGDGPAKPEKQDGLVSNPLGIPGDNEDDAHSGLTDCLGDGNSGHGDDFKHGECNPRNDEPPPPPRGCDDQGCCEDPEDPSDDPTDDPQDDPSTDPNDDPQDDPSDDPTTDPGTDPTDPTDPEDPTDPSDDPTSDPTTDPTDDPTSDPNDDCSHLDDACGRGVLEPDSGICYYLPSGWCEG